MALRPADVLSRAIERPTAAMADTERPGTRLVAQILVIIAGLNVGLPKGLTLTVVLAVLLAPVWLRVVRDFRGVGTLLILALLATFSGVMLSHLSKADHTVVTSNTVFAVAHLWSGIGALGFMLWARRMFSVERVAMLYAVGSLADGAFLSGAHNLSWKYSIGTPIAILAFAAVGRLGRTGWLVLTALVLGVIGAINDARSFLGFCVLAATLTFWQRRAALGARVQRWAPAVLLAGVAAAVYYAGTALLTGGFLGPTLQARSVAQIDAAGSLIAGGRPEWFGTFQLMKFNPMGYGTGVAPNWADVQAAQAGLIKVGLQPDNGYVLNYMFGGQFRLHSIIADLWASFGWLGVLLGAVAAYLLIRNLSTTLSKGIAAPVAMFAVTLAVWDFAFGPIFSNWPDVCFALGLVLFPRFAAPIATAATAAVAQRPTNRPRAKGRAARV